MMVRLAFSVAIHANRDILLMDEVLAVGDSNFQNKCLQEFNKYRDLGKTVILVTHDILTVQKHCDRAMLLREGKIKLIGEPRKVTTEYLYQNMSDEEKRLFDEEKRLKNEAEKDLGTKKQGERKEALETGEEKKERKRIIKKQVAEVTRIELKDASDKSKNVFRTGEIINLDVICEIHQKIEDPIFGIIVSDLRGINALITNTDYKQIKTGEFEPGKICVRFSIENYFADGQYRISPAIASKGASIFYDWKDNFKSFLAAGEYTSGGVVDLKHSISINKKA